MNNYVTLIPPLSVHYIEVKGRAAVGGVAPSENEGLKAEQLGDDWLYVVTNAVESAKLRLIQGPGHRLPRQEVVPRVRYRVSREGWDSVAEQASAYET